MLSEFHDLAIRLAPELADAELRLLQHQSDWPNPYTAEAYARRGGRPYHIRKFLQRLGEWNGLWGSWIVFVTEPTIANLIHELGHLLPAKEAQVETDGGCELESFAACQLRTTALDHREGTEPIIPWNSHGPEWIRAVLHLHHRAAAIGVDVPLDDLNVAGETYRLSDARDYQIDLRDEPQRMAANTFAQIAATPYPPDFACRFARDVGHFHRQRTIEELLWA